MSDNNNENDFTDRIVDLQRGGIFEKKEFSARAINLKKHFELPQNTTWSMPRISLDLKFIAAKCKYNNEEKEEVYVWLTSSDYSPKYLYKYSSKKIKEFYFAGNSLSFIIISSDENDKDIINHYNIKTGKKIIELASNKPITGCLTSSFSSQSRFFALGTEDYFFVWDVLEGKLKRCFEDHSPLKALRDQYLCSITSDLEVYLTDISTNKVILQRKIFGAKKYEQIIGLMVNSDSKGLIYATKDAVYKASFEDDSEEILFSLEGTNPNKIAINSNCQEYIGTGETFFDYWKADKGNYAHFRRAKYKEAKFLFEKKVILIIDEVSISLQSLANFNTEKEIMKIYLDTNPDHFIKVIYGVNDGYLVGFIDKHKANLYETETGICLHKWNSKDEFFMKTFKFAPNVANSPVLAAKINEDLVQIFDYTRGIPIISIEGFNAYDFDFNEHGNIFTLGCERGEEIARIVDLDDPKKYTCFNYEGENNNTHCTALLTDDQATLICHCEEQKPLIFNVKKQEVIAECEGETLYTKTEKLLTNASCSIFASLGEQNGKGILNIWDINDGKLINSFENVKKAETTDNKFYLLFLTELEEGDRANIINIKENDNADNYLKTFSCDMVNNLVDINLLNDSKTFFLRIDNKEQENYEIYFFDNQTCTIGAKLVYNYSNEENNFPSSLSFTTDLLNKFILQKVIFEY